MLFVLMVLFVVATIAFGALVARVWCLEKSIRELFARRAADSTAAEVLDELREENLVMRNLIFDMVENEASLMKARTSEERARCHVSRVSRRRELFGEAVVILDRSAGPIVHIPHLVE